MTNHDLFSTKAVQLKYKFRNTVQIIKFSHYTVISSHIFGKNTFDFFIWKSVYLYEHNGETLVGRWPRVNHPLHRSMIRSTWCPRWSILVLSENNESNVVIGPVWKRVKRAKNSIRVWRTVGEYKYSRIWTCAAYNAFPISEI